MPIQTRVALAKAGTKSMKTTIPEAIVEYLQLNDKDSLEWQMGMKDDEPVALVRKLEDAAEKPRNFDDEIRMIAKRRKTEK